MKQQHKLPEYDKPVLLVGPAFVDFKKFGELARRGFQVIAADGGANRLLERGIVPQVIIGDMDSLDDAWQNEPRTKLLHIMEQESTDFEKCLYSIRAPLLLAFGFSGNRLDHTLANVHAMAKYHDNKKVLLVGEGDVSFVHRGDFTFTATPGQNISIFPLAPIGFANSEGLKYPLDGLEFEIGGSTGVSNLVTGERVKILPAEASKHTLYLISLASEALDSLIEI